MTVVDKPVLIYATFPSAESAEEIGGFLVDARLAACVNVLPAMTSIYRWDGKRQRDSEVAMVIKTRAGLVDRVVAAVRARHPYEVPALSAVEITGGYEPFLAWILSETAAPAP